ncbi:MAG TPA: hypothetical protein VHL59_12810 [Thermoanaerobaculia bacterium]|nr:hypothetical protein [Thermoanaerobaculia bacterium]
MTRPRLLAVSLILFTLAAGVAQASWYDDYDAGIAAARKGQWAAVLQKMTAALEANGKESNKARSYGNVFINYHPYYYRGIANLNLGNYEAAIADLEQTSGPGEVNLGPLELHLERAKEKLAAANEAPAPEPPKPEPARPTPAVTQTTAPAPALPQIDPALKQRASAALNTAKQKLQAAQQRRATGSQQYAQAMSLITDATTKNASVRNNDDLNAIISLAESAADLADLATAPVVASAPSPAPATVVPKPAAAADAVLADDKAIVRRALENYFAGEFDEATRDFLTLSRRFPSNGWIYAFLGASQYSQYAFEADERYRDAALQSFRKAKRLRSWKGGLPQKYFSRRIRKAFSDTAG